MATENGEKQGIYRSVRSQLGHGSGTLLTTSASNRTLTQQTKSFISRKLLRTDTLMGITLKYGVTIAELKKENKLWNNDHLFLRETLLIPLTPENENLLDENDTIVIRDGSSSTPVSPSSPLSHLPNGDLTDSSMSSRHSGSSDKDIPNGASASKPQSSSKDFFSKYDTSIERLKVDVAKMERNAADGLSVVSTIQPSKLISAVPASPLFHLRSDTVCIEMEENETVLLTMAYVFSLVPQLSNLTLNLEGIIDANPLALPPRKGSGASRRDSNSSTVSASERRGRYVVDEDSNGSPVLLIRSWANRHVKSTIENIQQVNDDLFEL